MKAMAVAAFGLCGVVVSAQAARPAESPGKVAYDRNCGVCHGPGGSGDIAPGLVPLDKDFAEVLAIVREGIGEMPPVGPSTLTDEGVKLIVEYLHSLRRSTVPADRRELPAGLSLLHARAGGRALSSVVARTDND